MINMKEKGNFGITLNRKLTRTTFIENIEGVPELKSSTLYNSSGETCLHTP